MYQLIGANCGWGAQRKECELGPDTLFEKGLLQFLQKHQISSHWNSFYPKKRIGEGELSFAQSLPILHDFYLSLADLVTQALEENAFPIVLGGDHSIAIGTWNGVNRYFQSQGKGPLGLIWIDAHMDAHTLKTTPSKAWHGMPLAVLLGYGKDEMAKLLQANPVLAPQNTSLIGTRSFEKRGRRFSQASKRPYFLCFRS